MSTFIYPAKRGLACLCAALLLAWSIPSLSQSNYTGNTTDLTISGTSTLHNWDMKSGKGNCSTTVTFNSAGHLSTLTALSFTTPANALKSEHTAMDNNAYKALKADKNPSISYTMTSASVLPGEGAAVTVKCKGKLTIAGTTRDEEIIAVCKVNADNTITVSGSQTISMKDFNMDPPTFMLGAVKTGNDVVLKFSLVLKRA